MAMFSDGPRVTNPKALASGTMGLGRLDQAAARIRNIHGKSTQSNPRERLYDRRRTLHARIVNVRNDNHRRAKTAKARSAGQVVVETLNGPAWSETASFHRRLSRAIADARMAGFRTKLEYQCAWYGADFMKADPCVASSGLCAHSGSKDEDMNLCDRKWW